MGFILKNLMEHFTHFQKLPNSSITSIDFCNKALQDYGLVVVPGKAFGAYKCIRISCAASEIKIKDGLQRIEKAISEYY